MEGIFDIRVVFTVIASLISLGVFINYARTVFKKETKPHLYTWLIWFVTQAVAVVGMWAGGGGLGAIALTVGTICVFMVMLLSLRYGTKNITKSDTIILVLALAAVFVWVQLDNPLLAVIMVTLIDLAGYVPSWRKSMREPWSENLYSWSISPLAYVFAIAALAEYNLLTLMYPISIVVANYILVAICLMYRPKVPKPTT